MEMRRPNGRRISFGPMRARCECAKTKPLYPGKCWVFIEASGAPPPVAPRDRLSSASHGSRIAAIARTAPGTFSRRKEREKGWIENAETNPLLGNAEKWCPGSARDPGARSDEWKVQEQTHSAHSRKIAKSDETKPKRSGECWGSGTSMVLHRRSRRATGSHPPVTVLASQPSREPRLAPSPAEKSGRRDGSRMQKQTHFSATPRSGAQGRRGTSSRPARR